MMIDKALWRKFVDVFLIITSVVLLAFVVIYFTEARAAPTLNWDDETGADGYRVYCGPTPLTDPVAILVTASTYDLVNDVVEDTQYECYVTSTSTSLPGFESPHSNHVIFSTPTDLPTITYPGQVKSLTISWE